ncbi:hypothetical protein BASA83_001308 [Batrachochytrium salamandrivorans]|nr:hypothetical protein BASA83_001308 [Batrachochytrium salamandrivorans]
MRFYSLVIFTLGSGVVHAGLLQKTLEKIKQVPVAIGLHFKKSHPSQFQSTPIVDPNPSGKYDMEGGPGDSPDGPHLPIPKVRDPGSNRHNLVQFMPQHHPPRSQLPTRHISFSKQKRRSSIRHTPLSRQRRRQSTRHRSLNGQRRRQSTRHIPPNGQKSGLSARHRPPNEQAHESSQLPPPEPAQNPLSDTDKEKYIKQLEETIGLRALEVIKLKVAKNQCTADLEKRQKDLMEPTLRCKRNPVLSSIKKRRKRKALVSLTDERVIDRMLANSEKALHEAEDEFKAVMS